MDIFDFFYFAAGAGAVLAAGLPRVLAGRPVSMPIVFLLTGVVLFALPLGLPRPDPVTYRVWVEHSTEAVVIIALMGAGLALDRPVGLRRWGTTWRMLGIAMPLTVAAVAGVAAFGLQWPLAAALLLGAVLAPTDPVLASDVQVGEPTDEEGGEDEVRFSLTSEAGLNDGLAFPLVYLAVAVALAGGGGSWFGGWLLEDLAYKVAAGVVGGLLVGRLLGWLFFRARRSVLRLSEHSEGFVALAATFLAYGLTELAQGYGFIAVFVAACSIRASERAHGYHHVLHGFIEQIERLLTAWLLLLLGGAVVTGALGRFHWSALLVAVTLVLVVRPAAGLVALVRSPAGWRERLVISFFGIRGVGSLYYLAYALGLADFGVADRHLWTVVTTTVMFSVLLHGISSTPVMSRLDLLRRDLAARDDGGEPCPTRLASQRL